MSACARVLSSFNDSHSIKQKCRHTSLAPVFSSLQAAAFAAACAQAWPYCSAITGFVSWPCACTCTVQECACVCVRHPRQGESADLSQLDGGNDPASADLIRWGYLWSGRVTVINLHTSLQLLVSVGEDMMLCELVQLCVVVICFMRGYARQQRWDLVLDRKICCTLKTQSPKTTQTVKVKLKRTEGTRCYVCYIFLLKSGSSMPHNEVWCVSALPCEMGHAPPPLSCNQSSNVTFEGWDRGTRHSRLVSPHAFLNYSKHLKEAEPSHWDTMKSTNDLNIERVKKPNHEGKLLPIVFS